MTSESDELTTMVEHTISDAIEDAFSDGKLCLIEHSIIGDIGLKIATTEATKEPKEVETEDDDIRVPEYKSELVNIVKRDIYHKGQLRRRQEGFYHPETGQFIKHGIEIGFYDTGEVQFELTWFENKKHGTNISYWISGKQMGFFQYVFDQETGQSMNWYENGNLQTYCHWSRGKLHGRMESYSEDGKINGEVEYYDGLKHGVEKSYHPNGRIKVFLQWNMGVETGVEKYWDPDGNISQKIMWHEGQIVNAYKRTIAIKKQKSDAATAAAALKAVRDKLKAKKASIGSL